MRFYQFVLFFLFVSFINPDFSFSNEKSDYLRKANNALKLQDIYSAADAFESAWKIDTADYELAEKIARLHFSARDYQSAKKFYEFLFNNAKNTFPAIGFYYGRVLKMNNHCDKAISVLTEIRDSYRGENQRFYRNLATNEIKGCLLFDTLAAAPYTVKEPGSSVNNPYSNISPLWWGSDTLLFSTLFTDTVITVDINQPAGHRLQFYMSVFENNQWQEAELTEFFNDINYHTANGAFSSDNKSFYFTKCREDKNMRILCAIYRSDFVNNSWQEAVKLPSEVNNSRYNQTQPAIGLNSRGMEVLYFVSDRSGGRGGNDIWFSLINRDGTYRDAINAGPVINTEADEQTPWYDSENAKLYFSSNGHPGLGGFDVFYSEGDMRRWSEPVNMGKPINSAQDDMYFQWKDSLENMALIVSNRPGETISLRGPTCCDNIYFLEKDTSFRIYVKGRVYDIDDRTKSPLSPSPVSLHQFNSDIILKKDTTIGINPYFFTVDEKTNYTVRASHEGYLSGSSDFSTIGMENRDTLVVDVFLRKLEIGKAYRLENVYYDFDKWDLRPESKETLDTLLRIMNENPNIIVELSSHTDQRGSEAYNNVLSQRRAESCMRYLIQQGIDRERLRARGYGKARILEDCSIYPDCPMDSEEDCPCHQFNRRTEFTVIGELDGELLYDDVRYGE
ncbi:MAG: OmpA family protein [Chitinophagaceae bacterium]|nr:MAG: OmpA family protein [Chitinophagaceae bacterium]